MPIAGTPFSTDTSTGRRVLTGGVIPYDPNARIAPVNGQGTNWADVIAIGNQAALQWFATATQKPVLPGTPTSTMRNVFGTDFGGSPTPLGQATAPIGALIVIVAIVVGIVIVARR
jgi:hypothetical protein